MHNNEKKKKVNYFEKTITIILSTLFWTFLIFGFEGVHMAYTTLLCALIHELGHVLYLVLFTGTSHRIKSVIFGLKIRAVGFLSYKQELLLYMFGPLFNVICGIVFLLFSSGTHDYFFPFAIVNFATAFSNLLPIEGYDGHGMLRVLCEKYAPGGRLASILSYVSTLFVFSFCIFSIYLIDRYGGGYWIFVVFFVQMIKHFTKKLK